MRILLLASLISIFMASCSQKPTRVYENEKVKDRVKLTRPVLEGPLRIDEDTIVIDTRDAFSYSMAHIRRSVNLSWTEFSEARSAFKGPLASDLFFHARRLARLGVSPKSKVVVIDGGKESLGAAGRVAWTLYYMGVRNVQYAHSRFFQFGWTNTRTEKPYANQKVWKPQRKESIWVRRAELKERISKGQGSYFSHTSKKTKKFDAQKAMIVIDVRSSKEYQKSSLDLGAIHIEWTEFFDEDGRPKSEMKKKLQSVGITKDKRIVVISNQGLRSAAVTMALLDLGFVKAGNYAIGYQGLVN